MATLRKVFLTLGVITILTMIFILLQDVPEVRRFTDRAIQAISLVGLGLLIVGVVFLLGQRLGRSAHISNTTPMFPPDSTWPSPLQPGAPQIFMLPPAQSNLPREVWERPLSSNQSPSQSFAETSTPRKVDWSVIS